MPGLRSRAVSPRIVSGGVDESALVVTRHAPLVPMCGLVDPGRNLLTATVTDKCARALRATVRGRDDCTRDRLAVARPGATARSHIGHVTVAGLVTALLLLTARGLGRRVADMDKVTGIAVRLLLLPAIVATLG